MKMFDIDREAAIEIQNIIREQKESVDPEDVLQFLPPSYGSSSISSSTNSFTSGHKYRRSGDIQRGNGFIFLKKVMPWPFMFIK